MERLEKKKINGTYYYYYGEWGWSNGKCKRLWQKYLGKLEDIVKAVEGNKQSPLYAEVFHYGLSTALWKETQIAEVIANIDKLCSKREQGLSTGEYMAIAAINRAYSPVSKKSMWEWFSQTSLMRYFPNASQIGLKSQRFWDHMSKISEKVGLSIWKNIIKGVIKREEIDLSSVSYDGTNFYTFIDTFNMRCQIAKRGKNKQGCNKLRQISYALFCCADGHIPLYYNVYDGNINDAKQFPLMIRLFSKFLKELAPSTPAPNSTIIFDKGNNSEDNFSLIDILELNYVGSVKLDQVKDLAGISNQDEIFEPCEDPDLEKTKAFRTKRKMYNKERIMIVTFNQNLFDLQWLTLHNDISKAVNKLRELQQKLEDRVKGIIKGGKTPTVASVKKQCEDILKRQYMKDVIKHTVSKEKDNIPRLIYEIDTEAIGRISDTYLGKNVIITNRERWSNDEIIKAYRSQYIIEDVFKEMKDRMYGNWWPLNHWTDQKIRVHALYCTIALLIRALMFRRIKKAGIRISLKRMLTEMNKIKEVINIYPKQRGKKITNQQTVFTKLTELQQSLVTVLNIDKEKTVFRVRRP
jgi:transposase